MIQNSSSIFPNRCSERENWHKTKDLVLYIWGDTPLMTYHECKLTLRLDGQIVNGWKSRAVKIANCDFSKMYKLLLQTHVL